MEEQGNHTTRTLIAVVVSTVALVAWFYFFGEKPKPATPPRAADAGQVATPPETAAPTRPEAPTQPEAEAGAPVEKLPEERTTFATPAQKLTFSSDGGGVVEAIVMGGGVWPARKFVLPGRAKGETRPVDMATRTAGMPVVGAAEITGGASMPATQQFRMEREEQAVSFRAKRGGIEFSKRFVVNSNGYDLAAEYRVTNLGDEAMPLKLRVLYPAYVDPALQKKGGFFSPPPVIPEAVCRHDTSTERLQVDDSERHKPFGGPVRFAGFSERYFLGAVYPTVQEGTQCELSTRPNGEFLSTVTFDLGTVGPGQSVTRKMGLYFGPKSHQELARVSEGASLGAGPTPLGTEPTAGVIAGADPQLGKAVNLGFFEVISRFLIIVLKLFQSFVVNWGVAIILLTVLVKTALYPLSRKQMESMEGMRALQPKLDVLAKKYAGDKEKLNQERMRLFQENKINPLGGCLPILIQMPVWWALYQALLGSFEIYREPLLGFWVTDLTAADPFYILPLAMGVTMFITQKMQPQMGDPTQAKIMLYFMPIFFTAIMWSLPAGLTLYIFTNNLLSIAQQKFLQRQIAKRRAAAA